MIIIACDTPSRKRRWLKVLQNKLCGTGQKSMGRQIGNETNFENLSDFIIILLGYFWESYVLTGRFINRLIMNHCFTGLYKEIIISNIQYCIESLSFIIFYSKNLSEDDNCY